MAMKNSSFMQSFIQRVRKFSGHPGYVFLIALFAALDAFIFIIPTELLMVTAVISQKKRWIFIPIWIAIGSTLGAGLLAIFVEKYGQAFVQHWMPHVIHSKSWAQTEHFFKNNGGWTLPLIAISPIPQQPAVILASLLEMDLFVIILGVLAGRLVKYILICWAAFHSPQLLKKLKLIPA
jgi:membrane protein YqaA with SNARE-associated domain